jgi:hypothetical protein
MVFLKFAKHKSEEIQHFQATFIESQRILEEALKPSVEDGRIT